MPSRQRIDPLASSTSPRWLVITDMFRQLVSVTPLAPGADLRVALRAAIDGYAAGGWQAEGGGSYGFVFINRGGRAVYVAGDWRRSGACTGGGARVLGWRNCARLLA